MDVSHCEPAHVTPTDYDTKVSVIMRRVPVSKYWPVKWKLVSGEWFDWLSGGRLFASHICTVLTVFPRKIISKSNF